MKEWTKDARFYHIYPLGFCGAPRFHEEGIKHRIRKIKEWIPHIKALHCNAVYVGPVFESFEHGYDTSDYQKIDQRLGNNEDFKEVCDALHEAGIRIVLDGVFNHVGRDFWAFKDVQEKQQSSPYCGWFHNLRFDTHNPLNDPFTYDAWEGHYNLIKLNLKNEEVVHYLLDSIAMWMEEYHIDGLRLDAADCIEPDFFKRLKQFCRERNADFWLMGEIIHGDYNRWANEEMLDSVTNYECYKGLYSSHNEKNYFEIAHSLQRQFGKGGIYADLVLYNFVDNHDVNRLGSSVKRKQDLSNIYTLLYTMPGIPSIYYGSEWALMGRKHDGSDADIRPCLPLEDTAYDLTLCAHLQRLGAIHEQQDALRHGTYEQILVKNEQFVFKRTSSDCIYIALNVSDQPCELQFAVDYPVLQELLTNQTFMCADGKLTITLPAKQAMILAADSVSEHRMHTITAEQAPLEMVTEQTQERVLKQQDMDIPSQIETPYLPEDAMELQPGKYEHYKGKHYAVLYVATHSETLERYVVYRQLYGTGGVWIRPLAMFQEQVDVDGVRMPRFRYIGK